MAVVDKDLGFDRIRIQMGKIDGAFVDVGYFEESVYSDGTQIAEVAAANTFGTDDGRIPERPFMQNTLDNNERKYLKIVRDSRDEVFLGRSDVRKGMVKLGEEIRDDMVKEITDLREPPNADITEERKGSTNPLIDTGQMRDNVKFKVRK